MATKEVQEKGEPGEKGWTQKRQERRKKAARKETRRAEGGKGKVKDEGVDLGNQQLVRNSNTLS